MQVHKHWQDIPADARGASVAMGNFDGVHLGHQAVIDLARSDAPLGILTFEPHPREYFSPAAAPFRLMNTEARANRLAKLGVQHLYELPFDQVMASFTPEDFAQKVLADGLGISHVVVGADFCFGAGRKGKAADLRALGQAFGFDVTIADLIRHGDREVSSTAIRQALSVGNPRDAATILETPLFHNSTTAWSLPEAFGLHMALGKDRVEARTRELGKQLKEGLQKIAGVRLVTPMDPQMSSGIVSFDVDGQEPRAVTRRLRDQKIITSTAPYAKPYVRLTPSIRNTPKEIDIALRALSALTS